MPAHARGRRRGVWGSSVRRYRPFSRSRAASVQIAGASMAIGWIYLKYLQSRGMFRAGKAKILDIGCQNLFSIPENEGVGFLLENRPRYRGESLRQRVRQLSGRSTWPKGIGEQVFFSEFVALCGLEYSSYDIFPGRGVHIFDMNSDTIPPEHHQAFDC